MFECLVTHGCTDLTSLINNDGRSSSVIASGGFGDVRRVILNDGTLVAVKTLRLHILLEDDAKAKKVEPILSYHLLLLIKKPVHHSAQLANYTSGQGFVIPMSRSCWVSLYSKAGSLWFHPGWSREIYRTTSRRTLMSSVIQWYVSISYLSVPSDSLSVRSGGFRRIVPS